MFVTTRDEYDRLNNLQVYRLFYLFGRFHRWEGGLGNECTWVGSLFVGGTGEMTATRTEISKTNEYEQGDINRG